MADLPNAFGGYDETAEDMAKVGGFLQKGSLNLVRGYCGTTRSYSELCQNELKAWRQEQLLSRVIKPW